MSQTGNKMIDHKGKSLISSSGPKDTTRGADLGLHATNKKASWGPNPSEASPSATSQSRNK